MAEILGAVASGVTLTNVAISAISASHEIRRLLKETDNAPANLQNLFDRLVRIEPLLSILGTLEQGPAITPELQRCFCDVDSNCREAAKQLKRLAHDLKQKIEGSQGVRKKIKSLKAVLRKDTINDYQARLDESIQYLSLAYQVYTASQLNLFMSSQRLQSDLVASKVMKGLNDQALIAKKHQRASSDPLPRRNKIHFGPNTVASRDINSLALSHAFRVGFKAVTGTIDYWGPAPSEKATRDHDECQSNSDRDVDMSDFETASSQYRISFNLPTWYARKTWEFLLCWSQVGWDYQFRPSQIHAGPLPESPSSMSDAAIMFLETLAEDNLMSVKRLFADREIAPLDRIAISTWENNHSLLHLAIQTHAWGIANYLLDKGVRQDKYSSGITSTREPDESSEWCDVAQHDDLTDESRMLILRGYGHRSVQDFESARRRLWPCEDDFYNRELSHARHNLAHDLSCFGAGLVSPDHIWSCLAMPLSEEQDDDDDDDDGSSQRLRLGADELKAWVSDVENPVRMVLHTLARAALLDDGYFEEWWPLMTEVLHCHQKKPWNSEPMCALELAQCSVTNVCKERNKKMARVYRRAFEVSGRALRAWVTCLRDSGFDLSQYASVEKRRFAEIASGKKDAGELEAFRWENGEAKSRNLRLWGISCGSKIEDWEYWWGEPTDDYARDLWDLVDPEPLAIPGAWVAEAEVE